MDWVEDFLTYTEGIMSPEIFRLWTAIGILGGAMERRCWSETRVDTLYPNMFIMLVAPPGVGKSQALKHANRFWRGTKELYVAPDSMTKASMMDALAKADRKILHGFPPRLMEFHSLQVVAPELGVFLPSYDTEFLSALNYIWDCPDSYTEERRTNNKSLNIINPQCTIIAGTQPGYMAAFLPEEAWSMGTTARFTMIYSGTAPKVSLFAEEGDVGTDDTIRARLQIKLTEITKLMGKFKWEYNAAAAISKWYDEGCQPVPTHSRLEHYRIRRHMIVMKLAMISSISRGHDLQIKLEDVTRAKDWVLEAEVVMPDLFRHMAGRSDTQVLQELHRWLWHTFNSNKKAPVHESRVVQFISNRVPSEKVIRIMDVAEKAGMMTREVGYYTPKPINQMGVE